MAMLCDTDIFNLSFLDKDLISPFNARQLQPASYDLTLGHSIYHPASQEYTQCKTSFVLKPKQFVLGATIEYLKIPDNLYARFEGKSSLGRQGLMTHITAGFIDPGFHGQLTLEIYNVSEQDILLVEGMFIGQVCFGKLTDSASVAYGSPLLNSHYQKQVGPTPSKSDGINS